jgi:hypothetical protein
MAASVGSRWLYGDWVVRRAGFFRRALPKAPIDDTPITPRESVGAFDRD